ncbi:MAG TPA: phosphoglycerate kinase [Candidatus Saccharimonadales bacterium]
MFTKQTIRDIDLKDKRVLLRADYNVPIEDGEINDDYRIKQSLPTLNFLLDKGAAVIICSHLGRPKGPNDTSCSLKPVAERLEKLLQKPVEFVAEPRPDQKPRPGEVWLLENLRFHPEEEKNDDAFAKQLASLADVFVQDGFGVVHRAHASTAAITKHLPSVAGLLLEKEVDTITNIMEKPERPLAVIIGGAKIADKIDILHRFIEVADFVAIGGAMANTFLVATGVDVADSLVDKSELPVARDILKKAAAQAKERDFTFALPRDGVVAHKIHKLAPTRIVDWGAHVVADVQHYPKRVPHSASHVRAHERILDIGPFSGAFIAGGLQLANTVVWNGTMGVTETDGVQGPVGPYAHGTELVIEAMLGQFGNRPFSLVGGGDTVGYVQERGLTEAFDHVSTGGGASLELMAGRTLPGVAALRDKV